MSIKIKPVRFTENGFMTEPFALGGEGVEGLDPNVKYRSCLQNWVIDTGSEVILVDTGLPAEFPDAAPTADEGEIQPRMTEEAFRTRGRDLNVNDRKGRGEMR